MTNAFTRRRLLLSLGALSLMPKGVLAEGSAAEPLATTLIGAAWRGPKVTDSHFAGVLAADWERQQIEIRYAVALPSRPHGLVPEAGGGLLVNGLRPGAWLLRCDGDGKVMQRIDVTKESENVRLSGHIAVGEDVLYATAIDYSNDQGRISIRDRQTLQRIDEWASGGIEPHQAVLDAAGHLLIANGGVPRTLADVKFDLHRMESSLVRLDGRTGQPLGQWRLDDPRLSLRHLAWSQPAVGAPHYLGIAMQAEHDDAARRDAAPILALFDGSHLSTPTRANDGHGYCGDIVAAFQGGFALSSNKGGVAQLWLPGSPDKLASIVEMEEAYALTDWAGPPPGGGVLVATAPGLVRWHPSAKPAFLAWPKPMALDNHWVRMG
ncbi:MAG: DUF1513 domain-containing protein [Gammaproteobacteria bacterium]|nr:DUF1513 domain-containing protein [Gammaproteobacteria bacterium]